jgi:predicted branched-subunit amino acid permease
MGLGKVRANRTAILFVATLAALVAVRTVFGVEAAIVIGIVALILIALIYHQLPSE